MTTPAVPLSQLTVENFGCLRATTIDFGPLTVLVGPNDSGKTMILRAIETLGRVPLGSDVLGSNALRQTFERKGGLVKFRIAGALPDVGDYTYSADFDVSPQFHGSLVRETLQSPRASYEPAGDNTPPSFSDGQNSFGVQPPFTILGEHGRQAVQNGSRRVHGLASADLSALEEFSRFIASLQRFQLAAPRLRRSLPAGTSSFEDGNSGTKNQPHAVDLEADGTGLPDVLEDMLRTDRDRIQQIEEVVRRWFPFVRRFNAPKNGSVSLEMETQKGARIEADSISDGILLVLGYLTLALGPVDRPLLLIDEPETGVHPALLRNLADFFRALSTGESLEGLSLGVGAVQIILTTHSPLLVNALDPAMVRIVRRDHEGATQVTPFPSDQRIERLLEIEGPGEVWVNETLDKQPETDAR